MDDRTPRRSEGSLRLWIARRELVRTFATLPGFVAYCRRLPTGAAALALRLLRLREFPVGLAAEPGR